MKIYFSLILILLCAVTGFGQTSSCNLQLEVYKIKSGSAPERVQVKKENVVLKNKQTQKRLPVAMKDGLAYFADLPEAKYEAGVTFPGYKTTVKPFDLDCSIADEQKRTSEVVFLWEGNSRETMSMDIGIFGVSDGAGVKVDERPPLATAPDTSAVAPKYPAAARAVHASGPVNVQVYIDELGRVTSAKALDGHPLLRQAAENAALASKFPTTTMQGIPVKVKGVIVYNFAAQ